MLWLREDDAGQSLWLSRRSVDLASEYERIQVAKVLHCWTMVVGAEWDYEEFQAMIMFRLTAFPKVKIDLDI